MTPLDALLAALPRWILVGGKGGVGKTTCSAALAARSAESGARTLLLSTDPARSLGDAIGMPLDDVPRALPSLPWLFACQLDAERARAAFLERWRSVLVTIVDRGTYLDESDITGLVDAALPGADEAMALLTLADLEADDAWDRVVVDTAPTGHTLRLLALPDTFSALVGLLDRMQEKHRFMVSALTHRYRDDEADAFLDEMRRQLAALRAVIGDPGGAAAVLVTRPELVVVAETARYAEALSGLGMRVGALVGNAVPAAVDGEAGAALAALETVATGAPRFHVPLLDYPPLGLTQIRGWGDAMREGMPTGAARHAGPSGKTPRAPSVGLNAQRTRATPAIRPLTIVGGKGGVGKTSVACALAVAAARADAPVLLVSTDPAPSIADALSQPIGDEEAEVAGVPGLVARQMDAAAAFRRLQETYRERIDALFDSIMGGRGMDAAHDRAIFRDLLALAPPGVDELYALASLGETLAGGRFTTVVVDPAPTGHLLRLLQMPELALEWSHRLMRLMLKYREVAGLGDAAEELLGFARRTRAVGALLRDDERSGLLAVALDEPLVRAETERLVEAVRALGIAPIALIWNRVGGPPRPLEAVGALPQFLSFTVDPPPRGVAAIRRWHATWEHLAPRHD